MSSFVEIVSLPQGANVPLFVRQAWIGLTLPYSKAVDLASHGVYCPKGRFKLGSRRKIIYVVPQFLAIAILLFNGKDEAADWWIKNRPHGEELTFGAYCARVVPSQTFVDVCLN